MGLISSGDWLTRARGIRVAIIFGLVSLAILTYLLVASSGTLDWRGKPLGTDFSQVWTAGRMALDGRTAWTSGSWDFGNGDVRHWKAVNVTSSDVALLTKHVESIVRRDLRARRAAAAETVDA